MFNIETTKPIFVISDLHIGDGGRIDPLRSSKKQRLFNSFLDHIDRENGELVITGDLLEMWHCKFDRIINRHHDLLHRLNEMACTYVVGNHDNELLHEDGYSGAHPFLSRATGPVKKVIGSKAFKFMHGHEIDPFIKNRTKQICKAFGSIVFKLDLTGHACTLSRDILAEGLLEIGEIIMHSAQWLNRQIRKAADECCSVLSNEELALLKRRGRTHSMLNRYRQNLNDGLYDVAIAGHTHKAGRFSNWYYNTGSWTAYRSSYLRISPDGVVGVHNWTPNGPTINDTTIGS